MRYRALYLDVDRHNIDMSSEATAPVMAFVTRLRENGFSVSEELLHALNAVTPDTLADITAIINEVMCVNLNWAPLVKDWKIPTGETYLDHIITFMANLVGMDAPHAETTLPCGHFIPKGTFPLERYNGCPYCGRQFKTSGFVYKGQASTLKELRLFTDDDLRNVFISLLESATPLDATQSKSLQQLLKVMPHPTDVEITMKETAMLVTDSLIHEGKESETFPLMKTPTDILRYIWWKKTGQIQIIEPRTLIKNASRLYEDMWGSRSRTLTAKIGMKRNLRLKYDRHTCRLVARWLNGLQITSEQAAEDMNPKRGMWVRMIHALRLGEYSRREGFGHLAAILDTFYKYKENRITWQGRVDQARKANDAEKYFSLMQQRPGIFARNLFSSMLRFGGYETLAAFAKVADRLPVRLLLSLANAAEIYFYPESVRLAKPITGKYVNILPNKLLTLYSSEDLQEMADAVAGLYKTSMKRHFAAQSTHSRTIYIDPMLRNIPISVGDRATTIQDTSCALQGTRFPVEGDAVRLFLQWGKGLHAQHLDMDLSCRIVMRDGSFQECAYYSLTCVGAKHSGDIRYIPEMTGTAEYIELSLPELENAGAKYAIFTCNAYSGGSLSPNLVVGWMNSVYPMDVSESQGVAYDPSCVQHAVRISESNLGRGLVFGMLDVQSREIIWLEMPNTTQILQSINTSEVEAMLRRLQHKITIGQLLDLKAEAQGLEITDNKATADEIYTYEWALNPAAVTRLIYGE